MWRFNFGKKVRECFPVAVTVTPRAGRYVVLLQSVTCHRAAHVWPSLTASSCDPAGGISNKSHTAAGRSLLERWRIPVIRTHRGVTSGRSTWALGSQGFLKTEHGSPASLKFLLAPGSFAPLDMIRKAPGTQKELKPVKCLLVKSSFKPAGFLLS